MRVVEKKSAKVVFTRSEMLALCDGFTILRELDVKMDDNKAKYVDIGDWACEQEDIQLAIEILRHITSVRFSVEENGFPIEIAEDV